MPNYGPKSTQIGDVVDWIKKTLKETGMPISDLSSACGLNRTYLTSLINKYRNDLITKVQLSNVTLMANFDEHRAKNTVDLTKTESEDKAEPAPEKKVDPASLFGTQENKTVPDYKNTVDAFNRWLTKVNATAGINEDGSVFIKVFQRYG